MPITIKQNLFKYKNPTTGQYQSIDAVTDATTSERIAAIEAAGASVLDEIPASYTDLSSNLITMQETQPTNEYNKMWIKNGTSYQVPTVDDFNSAISKDNISQTIFKGSDAAPANLNNDFFGVKPYNPSSANSPVANTYGAVQSFTANGTNWKYQVAFDTLGRVFVRRNINNGGWQAWSKIILESDLNNGTTAWQTIQTDYGEIVYYKRAGIVTVVGKNLSIPDAGKTICTMPVGYRTNIQIVGQLTYTDGAEVFGYYSFGDNGNLYISNRKGTSAIHIWFNVSYPAMG